MTREPQPYQPDRSAKAKLTRRLTQWRAAAPAWIAPGTPALSITFDDFPASAVDQAAPILERAGVQATYYACGRFVDAPTPFGHGYTQDHLANLKEAGHEIACHTFSHLDCAQTTPAVVEGECVHNSQSLAALGVETPSNFAFPYGETTFATKRLLAPRFVTGRGIMPGVNVGRIDRLQLRSAPLFGQTADRACAKWLTLARQSGGWLTVFTHDVAANPSPWGVTPDALARFLDEALRQGFHVAPVQQIAQARLGMLPP
ncbi:MAG: polysaccharide deacetylase family protein [Caulobacterales bacterium]